MGSWPKKEGPLPYRGPSLLLYVLLMMLLTHQRCDDPNKSHVDDEYHDHNDGHRHLVQILLSGLLDFR